MTPTLIGLRFALTPVVVPVVVPAVPISELVEPPPVVVVLVPPLVPATDAGCWPATGVPPPVVVTGAPSPLLAGAVPPGAAAVGAVVTVVPQAASETASRPASSSRDPFRIWASFRLIMHYYRHRHDPRQGGSA